MAKRGTDLQEILKIKAPQRDTTRQAATNAAMRVSGTDISRKPITFEHDVKPYQNLSYGARLGKTVIDGAGNNIVGGLLNAVETNSNQVSFDIQNRVEKAKQAQEMLNNGGMNQLSGKAYLDKLNELTNARIADKFAYQMGVRGVSNEEMQKNSLGRMHLDKGAQAAAEATAGTSGITQHSLNAANMGATLLGNAGVSATTGIPFLVVSSIGAGGSAAYDAAKLGADADKQALYGTAIGLSNAAIEGLGGIGGTQIAAKVGGKLGAKLLPKAVKKAFNTTAGKIAKNALEEGAEEALQYEVERRLGNSILDTDREYDPREQAVNAMYGGLMGGVFGGVRAAKDIRSDAKAEKQAQRQYVADEMAKGRAVTDTFEPQKRTLPQEMAEKLTSPEVIKDIRTQQSTVSLPNDAADAVPRLYVQDARNGASIESISPDAENINNNKNVQFDSSYGDLISKVRNSINDIKDIGVVSKMTGEEFPKGNDSLTVQVGKFFASLGNKVIRPNFGEVVLNGRGIKDSMAHGIGRKKAIAFAAVPDVIKNGKVIDFQENWKGRKYNTCVIAAPVSIGQETHYMGVVLLQEPNSNRYYLHEVVTEKGDVSSFKTGSLPMGELPGDNTSAFNKSISQNAENIKNYQSDFDTESFKITDNIADIAHDDIQESALDKAVAAYQAARPIRQKLRRLDDQYTLTLEEQTELEKLIRGVTTIEKIPPNLNYNAILERFEEIKKLHNITKPVRIYNAKTIRKIEETAETLVSKADLWKDKKGWKLASETMERNIRDIVSDSAEADEIIKEFVTPVHENEAKAIRWIDGYRKRLKDLKLNKQESVYAHYLNRQRSFMEHERPDAGKMEDYYEKNKSKIDLQKVENALPQMYQMSKEIWQEYQKSQIAAGYNPGDGRQNYIPSLKKDTPNGLITKVLNKVGIEFGGETLPSSMQGTTQDRRPGRKWNPNALERTGNQTEYDAIKAFDKYLETTAHNIFHTEDVQKLRIFEDQLRLHFSPDDIKAQVNALRVDKNIAPEERNSAIQDLLNRNISALPFLPTEIRRYTDILAGKKSSSDRNAEQMTGRAMYTTVSNLEKRFAANMVGGNVGSALTNFIPLTQGGAELNKASMLRASYDTVKSILNDDGFTNKSTFLTNRKGSQRNSRSKLEIASDISSGLMTFIDQFTSNTLTRARYYDNMKKGMNENAAVKEADKWVAGVMADRSLGAMPTVFYSKHPLIKPFTMFNLEVKNQFSYLLKDIPANQREKGAAAIASVIFQFMLGAYLYNDLSEKIVGRRSAFDPLGILNNTIGDFSGHKLPNIIDMPNAVVKATNGDYSGFESEKLGISKSGANLAGAVVQNIPFVGGVFSGGRVPISAAFPDFGNVWNAAAGNLDGNIDGKKTTEVVGKELLKPTAYLALPFGGGQLKKVIEGFQTVNNGGSYSVNNEGRQQLDFPLYGKSPLDYTQNMVFGKYSSKNAQKYVDSGFKKLSANDTESYQEAIKLGIDAEFFYNKIAEMKKIEPVKFAGKVIESAADIKRKKIMEMDLTPEQKAFCDTAFTGTDKPADYSSEGVFRASTELSDKKLGQARVAQNEHDIPYEVFLEVDKKLGDIKSDKYYNGKSMNNASLKKKAYIDEIPDLSDRQRDYLYEVFDVSETVRNSPALSIIYQQKRAAPKMEIVWGK